MLPTDLKLVKLNLKKLKGKALEQYRLTHDFDIKRLERLTEKRCKKCGTITDICYDCLRVDGRKESLRCKSPVCMGCAK